MANAGPKCNHRLATSLWMHCRQGTDGFPPPAQPFATHCIGGRNSHYTDTPNTFICYGIISWNIITLLGERYYIYADPYSSWASWKSLGLPAALLWIINQEGRLQQRLNVQCIQLNSDQLPSSRTVVEHAELLGQFIKPQGHPLTIHFETKCCSDVIHIMWSCFKITDSSCQHKEWIRMLNQHMRDIFQLEGEQGGKWESMQ